MYKHVGEINTLLEIRSRYSEAHKAAATKVKPVVLKLGSTEPQGFGEAVAGVRLRSE